MIKEVIVILLLYIFLKGYKSEKVVVAKPEEFNPVQKKTLALVISSFVVMVVPSILYMFTKIPALKIVVQFCQPQVIMTICAALAAFMKLGDQRSTFKALPMNTLIMIIGMSMLIGIASSAGLVDAIGNLLSNSFPRFLVGPALLIFGAFLSFFSSGLSVVCPLLFPLIPQLAESMNLNPVMLFSCAYIGAMSSSLSPFSTGGSMIVGACPDAEIKDMLTQKMIVVAAIIIPLLATIMAMLGLFGFFTI